MIIKNNETTKQSKSFNSQIKAFETCFEFCCFDVFIFTFVIDCRRKNKLCPRETKKCKILFKKQLTNKQKQNKI